MTHLSTYRMTLALMVLVGGYSHLVAAQQQPDFQGMWSTAVISQDDPGWRAEDYACFFGCTAVQINYLTSLLDNPANDERPWNELTREARDQGAEEFASLLTESGRQQMQGREEVNNLDDICTPYGHFGMTVSVLPMQIVEEEDRLVFNYETHDTTRIVYMDGTAPPVPPQPTRLGHSIAHYEDSTLVIETTNVESAPFYVAIPMGLGHSDQLYTVERYTRSADGRTLDMEYTVQDPVLLQGPWIWQKRWRLSPGLELQHHDYDCSFTPGEPGYRTDPAQ